MAARAWTDKEIDVLLDGYFCGLGYKTIANQLNRKTNAITIKLSKMGMAYSEAECSYVAHPTRMRNGLPWVKQDKHLYDLWKKNGEKGGKKYIQSVLRRSSRDIAKHKTPYRSRKGFRL
jgi:hypothetical protein